MGTFLESKKGPGMLYLFLSTCQVAGPDSMASAMTGCVSGMLEWVWNRNQLCGNFLASNKGSVCCIFFYPGAKLLDLTMACALTGCVSGMLGWVWNRNQRCGNFFGVQKSSQYVVSFSIHLPSS